MSEVTIADLQRLYVPPAEAIQKAVLPHLIALYHTSVRNDLY
jgi:hypothetical protein